MLVGALLIVGGALEGMALADDRALVQLCVFAYWLRRRRAQWCGGAAGLGGGAAVYGMLNTYKPAESPASVIP